MLLVQRAVLQYLVPHHKNTFCICRLSSYLFRQIASHQNRSYAPVRNILKHLLSMAAMYTEIFLPFDKSGVA